MMKAALFAGVILLGAGFLAMLAGLFLCWLARMMPTDNAP